MSEDAFLTGKDDAMSFDTEAMALAMRAELEMETFGWAEWNALSAEQRAHWISKAGKLIQRYITRSEERGE